MNFDNPLIFTAAGIMAALLFIVYIINRLRKRAKIIQAKEKADRIAKFQNAITDEKKARADEQIALKEELLHMSKDAFKRYTKQQGYTYQDYLDTAFGKSDDPEHRFLFAPPTVLGCGTEIGEYSPGGDPPFSWALRVPSTHRPSSRVSGWEWAAAMRSHTARPRPTP